MTDAQIHKEGDLINNRNFGAMGEAQAKKYLIGQGYRVLHLNYRAGRLGEIDMIGQDQDTLCFIEVKTRSNDRYGTPAQAVSAKKQATIIKIAQIYMQNHNYYDIPVRFDVVELRMDRNGTVQDIALIKNAF